MPIEIQELEIQRQPEPDPAPAPPLPRSSVDGDLARLLHRRAVWHDRLRAD